MHKFIFPLHHPPPASTPLTSHLNSICNFKMYSNYRTPPQPMSMGGLRSRQGFVESESDFTGDESMVESKSIIESESAVEELESESAVEVTDYTDEDDGKAPRSRKYKKTTHPRRHALEIRNATFSLLRLLAFAAAAIIWLYLAIGTGKWLLEQVVGDVAEDQGQISNWLPPPLQLPEVQEGIRAQAELLDLRNSHAKHEKVNQILKDGQIAMREIRAAILERSRKVYRFDRESGSGCC
jgi:hypothetical protein